MWMRLALPSSLLVAWLVACGGSDSTTLDPTGDGPVITGAGGSTATTATTSASSGTTGQGGAGGMGAGGAATSSTTATTTSGSGGMPPVCNDAFSHEMNESELTAHALENGVIDDCDSSGGSVQGVIAGPNDVDWFTFSAEDTVGCQVDPTRALTQSQSGLRLCKYLFCQGNPTDVTCPNGTVDDTSPEGLDGCCGTNGFDVDLNCLGTLDDSAEVFIRIDQPGATASTCNEYTLNYHF